MQAAPPPFYHGVAVLATEKRGQDSDGSMSGKLTGRTGSWFGITVAVVPPEKEDKNLLHDPVETAANESVIKCASLKGVFKHLCDLTFVNEATNDHNSFHLSQS